ncbi:sporulation-delaying protein SdpB family protein [Corynebacterium ureicelerivorans]|uniref:sporulation-delaying protein SdpB family protein n=1 Tax=Corynebacterium ureicelerivorans TaxID=401472 RepID=UPI002352652F|nr:sporulation-delaying protein SdpB family protein [Corynebacterium ureicelerivorans]
MPKLREYSSEAWWELAEKIADSDPRTRWFAWGRSLLALGQLMTLVATPFIAFIVPVGEYDGAKCDSLRKVSLLCVGSPSDHLLIKRWILILILAAVVAGIYPRYTGILHAWATFSMSVSFTLPDGGEAIAFIVSLLVLPICLIDDRRNHWKSPDPLSVYPSWKKGISAAFSLGLRIQLAFIYLNSSIAKMGVEDWQNGSAEYYVLRDGGFGVSPPFDTAFLAISHNPWGSLLLTWAAICGGLFVGVGLLLGKKARLAAFILDVAFHVGIIITIGLWSFALVMIGAAALAANPMRGGVTGSYFAHESVKK